MKLRKLTNFFILIILIPTFLVEGQVYVRGYYRSNGVYVRPHYRTYPDGIPYNNYSFPGNYNPNTGEITPGDPLKYLEKYNTNLRIIPEPLKLPEPSILEIKLSEPSILKKYYPNNYFNKTSKIKFKKPIYTYTTKPVCWESITIKPAKLEDLIKPTKRLEDSLFEDILKDMYIKLLNLKIF
jgi:hypothetical protein